MRIGIGVPSGRGGWDPAFGARFAKMMLRLGRTRYGDDWIKIEALAFSGHLPQVRHEIVAEAYRRKCTHILWLDDDMVFPLDVLPRLLAHGKAVVGCNYPRRSGEPLIPTAFGLDGKETYTTDDKTGLEEVSHLGLGCVLTDLRVFELIESPFFLMPALPPHFMTCQGEDVYFCNKLRDAEVQIWCDHDLSKEIGHIGRRILTHADLEMLDA